MLVHQRVYPTKILWGLALAQAGKVYCGGHARMVEECFGYGGQQVRRSDGVTASQNWSNVNPGFINPYIDCTIKKVSYYDYWKVTPLINKPGFINPGLTLPAKTLIFLVNVTCLMYDICMMLGPHRTPIVIHVIMFYKPPLYYRI